MGKEFRIKVRPSHWWERRMPGCQHDLGAGAEPAPSRGHRLEAELKSLQTPYGGRNPEYLSGEVLPITLRASSRGSSAWQRAWQGLRNSTLAPLSCSKPR